MSSTSFDITVNTQQALASINTLRGSLAALASSAALVEFGTMADDMARMKTQLQSVTVEGQKVTDVMKLMQKGAMESGQSVQAYADTFVNMANGTRDMGMKQKELVELTTSVSRAMTLGGKSSIETASALNQLGQMFSKGAAEGDDLNTVIENSTILSQALQKHYNANVGALREMASQQKITSKGIAEAIHEAKGAIDEAWAKRFITLSESMNVAKTTAEQLADKFATQMDLGRAMEIIVYKLATTMINLGNILSYVGKAFEVIGLVLITIYAPIGRIVGLIMRLGEAWGWLVGAFTSSRAVVTGFFETFGRLWASMGDIGVFQKLKLVLAGVMVGFSDFAASATSVGSALLRGTGIAALMTTVWGAFAGAFEYVVGLFKEGKTIFESFFSLFFGESKQVDELTKAQEDYAKAMGFDSVEAMDKALAATGGLSKAQQQLQQDGVKAVEDIKKAYLELHNSAVQTTAAIGLSTEDQTRVNASLGVINKYRDAVQALQIAANKDITNNLGNEEYKAKTLKELAKATDNLKKEMESALAVTNADAEAQIKATRAYESKTFALNQLYSQQDAIKKLNDEMANVGASGIQKQLNGIESAADAAYTAQLRNIAAARGISVEQIPQAEKDTVRAQTVQLLKEQKDAQIALNAAQNEDTLSTQLQKLRIDQDEKLLKLNQDANNVGLPTLTKRYREIEAAAAKAERAQLNALAAARGVTVEELPAADKSRIHEANAAAIDKEKAAVQALTEAEARNDMRLAMLKHQYDQQATLRKLQDDINKSTLSETARAYYDIGAAADEAARSEIRAAAEKQGIKPEELPIEQVKAYYEANFKGIDELIAKTHELQAAQEAQMAVAFATKEKTAAAAKLQQIQDETAKLGMTEIEKKYYDIDAAARASAEAELAAVAARQGLSRDQLDAETVQKYYAAATQGTNALKQATAQGYAQSRTFATGWKQALNSYTEDATNAAQQASRLFKTTTQGMEDMIVKFAKTGKFEWKGFLSSIVEELLRSQITILLSNILNGGKSGSGGNGLIGGIADMLGLGGDTGIGGAISSALGGGSSGKSGSGVLGTYNNPMYVIVAGSQAGGTMNNVAKQGQSVLGNVINAVTKPAQSGTSWWDDLTGGISNFFTGNSGASSSNSSYGVLQSDQNSGSSIFDDIGDFFGGLFATGGNLPTGKWGIAGEAGPELIKGPASISSASQTASDFGSTNVTYNINAVDAQSFKAMIAADPSFIYAVTMQGARGMPKR